MSTINPQQAPQVPTQRRERQHGQEQTGEPRPERESRRHVGRTLQAAIVVLVAAAAAVWFAFFAGSGNEAPAAPGSSVGATTGDGSTSSGAEQSGTWTGQRELPCRPHGACVR